MPEQTKSSLRLYWLILIIISVLLGWYFYTQYYAEVVDWGYVSSEKVKKQEVPLGVEIKDLGDGSRLIINKMSGYQLKVAKTKYLYKNEINNINLVVQDFGEPEETYGGMPGCRVVIDKKSGSLKNINNEVKNECDIGDQSSDCNNYKIKEVNVGDIKWFDIRYFGNFIGSGWPELKTELDDSVYNLVFFCDDQDYIDDILENFEFVN